MILLGAALNSSAQFVRFEWLRQINIGFSALTGINYYGNWAENSCPDFLQQSVGKNFTFSFDAVNFNFRLSPDRMFELAAGMRFTFIDYVFKDPRYTLINLNGKPWPSATPDGVRKSKVHADYIGLPVDFVFNYGRFSAYAGITAEILLGAFAKYKDPCTRWTLSGVNPFRSVVEVGMTYRHFGIFANYAISPLYSPGVGSDARSLSFGLLIGL